MADKILAPSVLLKVGNKIQLFISGNTPLIYGPTINEVRSAIDAGKVGCTSFNGDELSSRGILSTLTWYQVDVEITRNQSVAELIANVASAVDSNLMSYWDVHVSEVREPGTSIGDVLSDVLPEVPTSTAASIVGLAVILVVILVVVK